MIKKLDLSSDLLIWPTRNGIQLIKPDKNKEKNAISLNKFYQLPLGIFFLTEDGSQYNDINTFYFESLIAKMSNFCSERDLIGKNLTNIYGKKFELLARNSSSVTISKKMKVFEENMTFPDGTQYMGYSFKFPCFDKNYKVNGILGVTLPIDKLFKDSFTLVESLNTMIEIGLFSSQIFIKNLVLDNQIEDIYLSRQQMQCLRLLIRGKTTKMIASAMKLSPRTVETYLNQIKFKLNVNSKSELIDKTIDYFLEIFCKTIDI